MPEVHRTELPPMSAPFRERLRRGDRLARDPPAPPPPRRAGAVHWSKYPPEGGRSVGFSRANRYGVRFRENVGTANAETVVVAQVEHIDGVRTIEAILG